MVDQIEAYKWYRLAAEQGDKDAGEEVVSVGALLSPKQIAEGERRCKEFKAGRKT
jgi:TPR repeat protein